VVGLDTHLRIQERRDFTAGTTSFVASELQSAVLRLQLACPALQLRKVANAGEAAQHMLSLTRALGQQPYKVWRAGLIADRGVSSACCLCRRTM